MTALIFDCDGVLADTERDGHRVAFNQMFEEFGVPFTWSEESYGEALAIAGGKERMRSLLTDEFVEQAGLPQDEEGQTALIAEWHRRKTELFRDGYRRQVACATGRGTDRRRRRRSRLVARRGVHILGTLRAGRPRARHGPRNREPVRGLAGDIVANKKPAPDIYELALDRLAAEPRDAIVIEDSRNGLLAATAAGLACLVTVSSYTADEDFSEAAIVVSSLGDPGGDETRVLSTHGVRPSRPYVTLDDLTACLAEEHAGPGPNDGGSGG